MPAVACPNCKRNAFYLVPKSTCYCRCGVRFRITRELQIKLILKIAELRAHKSLSA